MSSTGKHERVWDDDDISTEPFHLIQFPSSFYPEKRLRDLPITFVPEGHISSATVFDGDLYYKILYPNGLPPHIAAKQTPICNICGREDQPDHRGVAHELTAWHRWQMPVPEVLPFIDPNNYGLKYLSKYGWDKDEGKGLGPRGEGILCPAKINEGKGKDPADKEGLGFEDPKPKQVEKPKGPEKPKLLGTAGAVRKRYEEDKIKTERLRREIFGDDNKNKFLAELEKNRKRPGLDLSAFKVVDKKRRR